MTATVLALGVEWASAEEPTTTTTEPEPTTTTTEPEPTTTTTEPEPEPATTEGDPVDPGPLDGDTRAAVIFCVAFGSGCVAGRALYGAA